MNEQTIYSCVLSKRNDASQMYTLFNQTFTYYHPLFTLCKFIFICQQCFSLVGQTPLLAVSDKCVRFEDPSIRITVLVNQTETHLKVDRQQVLTAVNGRALIIGVPSLQALKPGEIAAVHAVAQRTSAPRSRTGIK